MAEYRDDWMRQRIIGWLTGLFAPLIGLYFFCAIYFERISILDCMKLFSERNVIPHVISLSAIVNLVFFFTFLKMNRDHSAHGVLGATFLYVFIVIYLKFF
ncbi:MAG: hypothetical protein ACKOQ6_10715 [Bacteroidota bacterium]